MNKILCKTTADGQVAAKAAGGLLNTTKCIKHGADNVFVTVSSFNKLNCSLTDWNT